MTARAMERKPARDILGFFFSSQLLHHRPLDCFPLMTPLCSIDEVNFALTEIMPLICTINTFFAAQCGFFCQVYDFSNSRGRCESPSKRSDSPAARSQSPFKMNPHQFIAPQKSASPVPPKQPPAAATPANTYRSVSPTRMVSSPARPTR